MDTIDVISRGMAVVMAVAASAVGAQAVSAEDGDVLTLAGGDATEPSYSVGVGISSLAKIKLLPEFGIDLTAVESAGSVENMALLEDDKAQFAIVDALVGHFARTGTGVFAEQEPVDDIRVVAALWRDAGHVIVERDYVSTGTIDDFAALQGMKVSLGPPASGALAANRLVMNRLGIDLEDDYDVVQQSLLESSAALQAGEVKAITSATRAPAAPIRDVMAASDGGWQLLEFTDAQLSEADDGLGLWTRYVIPAGTYPGQEGDVGTIGTSQLLVVRGDVDEEVVYQLTKAIFENLGFLRNIHEAVYETSLDRALTGLTMSLHPGALRYYQEVGLLTPDATLSAALSDRLQAEPVAFDSLGGLIAPQQPEPTVLAADAADAAAPATGWSGSQRPDPELIRSGKKFIVYFDRNEAEITSEQARQRLMEACRFADALPSARFVVVGHTDPAGDPVYNAELSRQRAAVVADVIRTHDLFDDRLHVIEVGSTEPVAASGDDAVYDARSRRVEVTVLPADLKQRDQPQHVLNEAPSEPGGLGGPVDSVITEPEAGEAAGQVGETASEPVKPPVM